MTIPEKSIKQLYAEYAASAPRLDLQVYVDGAQRRRDSLSDASRAIVSEMITLLDELYESPTGSPAAQKRAVWTLIDRYKASLADTERGARIAGSTEDTGYFANWVALWVTHGRSDVLYDPKTPVIEGRPRDVAAKPAPTVKRATKAAVARLPCPTCSGELLPVAACANVFGCAVCKETWHLTPARERTRKPVTRATTPRVRPFASPIIDGTRVCRQCQRSQPVDQYTYGDAGRTVRSLCKSCHKQQQAAARRQRAA